MTQVARNLLRTMEAWEEVSCASCIFRLLHGTRRDDLVVSCAGAGIVPTGRDNTAMMVAATS